MSEAKGGEREGIKRVSIYEISERYIFGDCAEKPIVFTSLFEAQVDEPEQLLKNKSILRGRGHSHSRRLWQSRIRIKFQ